MFTYYTEGDVETKCNYELFHSHKPISHVFSFTADSQVLFSNAYVSSIISQNHIHTHTHFLAHLNGFSDAIWRIKTSHLGSFKLNYLRRLFHCIYSQ